jgi:scyllo-inositol 2-dehydrogenase (NADP+)
MTSSPPIRVGLVGFGTGSSVFHAPLLQSSGRFAVTHVLERSTNKSEALTPRPTIVRSIAELLAAPIELVVISTPTGVHFEQAKLAMEAKKHVVVDKPLCITATDAQALVEIAAANGVVFSVFQNRRWDGDFLTVRQLIESGTLGEITHYEAHFDRYRPTLKGYWKETSPGGGNLYDLGAHLVDQALQLFGTPDAVDADVQIQREGAANDDYFRLEFKYNQKPGLKVIVTAGMLQKVLGPKYTVVGSNGQFVKYGEDQQEQSLRDGLRPGDASWGQDPETQFAKFTPADAGAVPETIPTVKGSYEVYYANVADAIQNGTPLLVHPAEVIDQIRILEDASKKTRVAIVPLDE